MSPQTWKVLAVCRAACTCPAHLPCSPWTTGKSLALCDAICPFKLILASGTSQLLAELVMQAAIPDIGLVCTCAVGGVEEEHRLQQECSCIHALNMTSLGTEEHQKACAQLSTLQVSSVLCK